MIVSWLEAMMVSTSRHETRHQALDVAVSSLDREGAAGGLPGPTQRQEQLQDRAVEVAAAGKVDMHGGPHAGERHQLMVQVLGVEHVHDVGQCEPCATHPVLKCPRHCSSSWRPSR